MSKKKSIIIIVVLIALAICCFVPAVFMLSDKIGAGTEMVVEVNDGVASPAVYKSTTKLNKDGEYVFSAKWWPEFEPGFITGLVVKNETGEEVFAVTAQKLTIETEPIELKKGTYYIELSILTDKEQTEAFLIEHVEDAGECNFEGFCDGSWTMEYSYGFTENMNGFITVGVIIGAVIGLLIVLLLIVLTTSNDKLQGEYDERQEIVRGKAFKYGFFAITMYFLFAAVLIAADVYIPMDEVILLFVGILFGGGVLITYSIWNDGYFSLNQSKKGLIISWVIITLVNIISGIINISNGIAIKDGKLALPSLNMICGIFFIYILAVLLVKMLVDKRNNE